MTLYKSLSFGELGMLQVAIGFNLKIKFWDYLVKWKNTLKGCIQILL